jgi:periplasmic protein TonB
MRIPRATHPARGAAGLARRDQGAELMRWGLSFALVAAVQGTLVIGYLRYDEPSPANEAPEAAVMIDLPPELALPPAESVESVASSAAEAVETPDAAEPPPDAVSEVAPEPPVDEAPPIEEALPADPAEPVEKMAAVDAAEPEVTEAIEPEVTEAVPEKAVTEPPTETLAEVAEPEAAEAVQPDEVVVSDVAPPRPPRPRTARPQPPPQPRREARPAERLRPPAQPQRQQASRAAVAGQRASGAGTPDRNTLTRFMSSVRAAIMRQKREVAAPGGRRTATVRFTIASSGALGGIAIASSSGDPELDRAAIAMVRRASPVAPIPAGVGRSSVQTRLPVRFD